MATRRALERAGQWLLHSSGRPLRGQYRHVPLHSIHVHVAAQQHQVDRMLHGAYREFVASTPDQVALHQSVDQYVRALILSREEHRTEYLDTVIRQSEQPEAVAEAEMYTAVRAAVGEYLDAVRTGLLGLDALTAAAGGPDDPLDWSAWPDASVWSRIVERVIAPVQRRIWERSYRQAAPDAPAGAEAAADDLSRTLVERLSGLPRRVWDRLRAATSTGLARGEQLPELRARLGQQATLEEWDGTIRTMTRTETMSALNSGGLAAAIDEQDRTGRTWTKTWVATLDGRTRPSHAAADGQTRPIGEPFTVGAARLQHPGDPLAPPGETVNCRCTATYRLSSGGSAR
ncbi:phage minor head protein [Streptomyces xiamenensis]|uniref:phage minor head protein n=1 Tax=Streptomyces xiamenensis TaxID=408015 RepID=UPI0037D48D77